MGRNCYFYSEVKADWGQPSSIEYARTAAFAYIRRRNLMGEFLKAQGITVSEDQVEAEWHKFVWDHAADHQAYLYINFVKEYKRHEKNGR